MEFLTRSLTAKDIFLSGTRIWEETPDRQFSIDPKYLSYTREDYQEAYRQLDESIQNGTAEIKGSFVEGFLIPRDSGMWNSKPTFENRSLRGPLPVNDSTARGPVNDSTARGCPEAPPRTGLGPVNDSTARGCPEAPPRTGPSPVNDSTAKGPVNDVNTSTLYTWKLPKAQLEDTLGQNLVLIPGWVRSSNGIYLWESSSRIDDFPTHRSDYDAIPTQIVESED